MAEGIKPLEGLVAVRPLENNDYLTSDPSQSDSPQVSDSRRASLAIVVAAGAKAQVKEKDTVFIRCGCLGYAPMINDTTYVVNVYDIVAVATD